MERGVEVEGERGVKKENRKAEILQQEKKIQKKERWERINNSKFSK